MTRPARSAAAPADVLLVSMPFGAVFWPSLGLSLLKAQLLRQGVSAQVRYFTITFAELIGEPLYERIAMNSMLTVRDLAGEWVFSGELSDQSHADVERYVRRILIERSGYSMLEAPVPERVIDGLRQARRHAAGFLDTCAAEIAAARPRVVGLTSVFQQHVASIAVARRIKSLLPDTAVVIGGANCEGVMGAETLRQFPWIDAAVSGEADVVFPDFVRRVLAGEGYDDLPGVRTHRNLPASFAGARFDSAPPVRQLDELPLPDYTEYFAQFGASRFDRAWQPGLFVETSRGCWWGERMHCTFCGLNGATMTYRSKSAGRALEEFTTLAARHPNADIQVVDNILDMTYLKTLLPELAARNLDFGLFYETKSNLKKDQVKLLADARIRKIQPGVESFSDRILAGMRKGVTGLQNVQMLKWCRQYSVLPLWNLIWGFPGEPPDEYAAMARLVPLLVHLPPPAGIFGLRLDRFSPNFDDAEALGLADVQPSPVYEHVYGVSAEARANLAYYFQFSYVGPHPRTYVGPLLDAVASWTRRHGGSDLVSVDLGDRLVAFDVRRGRRARLVELSGRARLACLAADAVIGEDRLIDACGTDGTVRPDPEAVRSELSRLVDAGLVLRDGKRYLSLAIPLGDYQPSPAARARIEAVVRRFGRWRRPPLAAESWTMTAGDFSFDRHGELVVG